MPDEPKKSAANDKKVDAKASAPKKAAEVAAPETVKVADAPEVVIEEGDKSTETAAIKSVDAPVEASVESAAEVVVPVVEDTVADTVETAPPPAPEHDIVRQPEPEVVARAPAPVTAAAVAPAASMAQAAAPKQSEITKYAVADNMDRYIAAMAPGVPLEPHQGAMNQLILWNAIRTVLNATGKEFNELWTLLLKYFADNNKQANGKPGVLSEMYINRFTAHVSLSLVDRRNFERMTLLLITTRDPSNRQRAIKDVDMRSILSGLTNETMKQQILGYYRV